MRLFAVGHGELPFASHYGGPAAEQIDLQVLKVEFAHLLAISLVTLAVASQSRLPSTGLRGTGKESEVGRMPVTLHERFQLAMVPGFHLGDQEMLDSLFQIGALVFRCFLLLGIGSRWLWRVLVSGLCGKAKRQKE